MATTSDFPLAGTAITKARQPLSLFLRLERLLLGFDFGCPDGLFPGYAVYLTRSLSQMAKDPCPDTPTGYAILGLAMLACAAGTEHWPNLKVQSTELIQQDAGQLHAGVSLFVGLCDVLVSPRLLMRFKLSELA